MEDKSLIEQRFELLKMARELLNEDYINRRAEDHNKWIAENDEMWRKSRRNVPYPAFAQYPTDEEIVRAASNLYSFIHLTPTQTPAPTQTAESTTIRVPPAVHVPTPEAKPPLATVTVDIVAPVEIIEPDVAPSTIVAAADTDIVTDPQKEEPAPAKLIDTSKLIPGWMRRTIN